MGEPQRSNDVQYGMNPYYGQDGASIESQPENAAFTRVQRMAVSRSHCDIGIGAFRCRLIGRWSLTFRRAGEANEVRARVCDLHLPVGICPTHDRSGRLIPEDSRMPLRSNEKGGEW